jgi:hypothetical protein
MKISLKQFTSLSVLLLSILLITGCGSDEPTTEGPVTEILTFYRLVESNEFSLQVPEDWETIQNFTTAYPENTIVAFRNNIQDHDFIANINVVRNEVTEGTTSADYAIEMFDTISNQLINYKKLNEESYTLYVGANPIETFLYEFQGINDPTETTKQFIQIYGTNGTNAYVATGSYDADDSELAIDQIQQSMRTFMLK